MWTGLKPTVLTKTEVHQVIERTSGVHQLIAQILYGSGIRLMECMRLRVKDIEFSYHQIIVRDTKGNEDRVTMLPQRVVEPLQAHLGDVKKQHKIALANGYGTVEMPHALARKYPNAEREWIWQYVFPSEKPSIDPRSGILRRHHLDESGVQKAVRRAAQMVTNTGFTSCGNASPSSA